MLLRVGDPGDLSELGILSGDSYLDVSARAAAEISALILERMVQRGSRSLRWLSRGWSFPCWP
jgi:hypothetical protein